MIKQTAISLAFVLTMTVSASAAQRNLGDMRFNDKMGSMKKAGVGTVIFPHTKHEKIYKCSACHPKIFKEKRGANNISMKFNMEQKFCGSPNCHNSPKAFPLFQCTKCHTHVIKPK